MNNTESKIYFKDPKLDMTILGRFLIRTIFGIAHFLFFGFTLAMFISEIPQFLWIGILFLIFWIDILLHFKKADFKIKEVLDKKEINLVKVVEPQALKIIEKAYEKSVILKKDIYFLICHQLLELKEVAASLKRLEINPKDFKSKLDDLFDREKNQFLKIDESELKLKIEKLVLLAFEYSLKHNEDFISSLALFFGIFKLEEKVFNHLLNIFNIRILDIEQAILFEILSQRVSKSRVGNFISSIFDTRRFKKRIIGRSWTGRPTPFLDRFSIDLTALAEYSGGFMVGHSKEYQRMIEALCRFENPNVLLVGDLGIGKRTLIKYLAYNIINDNVPKVLFDKRLVELHLSLIVAGVSEEIIEERLNKIVREIVLAKNIILVIPDIHNLVRESNRLYLAVSDAILPIIQKNTFPLIGTTYPKEFKHFIEPNLSFLNVFEIINVSEVTTEEAEKILIYESLVLEREHNIFITLEAIRFAVKLAKKHLHFKLLPLSAIEILKSAISEAKLRDKKEINIQDILLVVEQKSGIPLVEIDKEEKENLLNLEEIIHQKLINQNEAVKVVSDALREYGAGISKLKGPIASFLFIGPSGVGKTELAKILAEIQFGSVNNMIRVDMSEYQTKESIYKLIGTPDGNMLGQLTEAVLEKPHSLILLDEFEKAHLDILNIFLQVLDDGRLTDNLGRTIYFSNTIIIATSNAHSDIILEALKAGKSAASIDLYLKERLTDYFKPELLNRFSKIVVFNELSADDILKIIKLRCKDLSFQLEEKGIQIVFDESVFKFITKIAYDPSRGARLVDSIIEEKIKSPLAREILSENIKSGDKILVETKEDKMVFNIIR